MISDQLHSYIQQHIDEEPEFLQIVARNTHLKQLYSRMISGHLQGRILYMLTKLIHPKRILELGTFTGYSALCLAEAISDDGVVDTIEVNDELEDFIKDSFNLTPLGDKIKLHIGNALDIIPTLNHTYDLVLLDANKRSYCEYYELIFDKVNPGGVILADNVLWDGKVLSEPIPKDAQTKGIKEFNALIKKDQRVEKVILPVRDGLTIIRKKE